jgi:enoyl-CoA hydratase/carnithine racemase
MEISMNSENFVVLEERGHAGLITLNRPKALNALSLGMIRDITRALLAWKDAAHIKLVAIRGTGKQADGSATTGAASIFAPFGAFCAGGDIRFFHQAALAGDPALEDFFTEEYSLNHLIHTYPKPYVVFMDGINMGGGMGLSQGKALAAPLGSDDERANRASPVARQAMADSAGGCIRIATERLKMAMPETMIGLFPDVGGGWFLSRCMNSQPGVGEYLGLTGQMLHAQDALALGLADAHCHSEGLQAVWEALPQAPADALLDASRLKDWIATKCIALSAVSIRANADKCLKLAPFFDKPNMQGIISGLEANGSELAQETLSALRKRSPLMLSVTLELIRRARTMNLADELRLERDLVRHSFHNKHLRRSSAQTDTVEGIRALAVDKDHAPKWNPTRLEDVRPEMVQPFFESPWPSAMHPLRHLN